MMLKFLIPFIVAVYAVDLSRDATSIATNKLTDNPVYVETTAITSGDPLTTDASAWKSKMLAAATITYHYYCPGSGEQWQAFGVLVQWINRRVRYTNRGGMDTLGDTAIWGHYPYYSTATFTHKRCDTKEGKSCLHSFEGEILVKVSNIIEVIGVKEGTTTLFAPTVKEFCVPGGQCDSSQYTRCKVLDVTIL